ncbi:interleukin-22 [Petaurus breviceps papuanus]|uniref:interleukin-22 n=1 Tax=Petaurus breviceps papuanus TaxID=3040969 RepID=UPI0036DDD6BB
MKTQQILESFFHMGSLTLCFLLVTLLAQGGEGTSTKSSCKLRKSNLQPRFISHQIITLAKIASLSDEDTSTRLLESSMFNQVEDTNRCYLMKEILSLVLKKVSVSYPQKFQRYMRDVLPFLHDVKTKLNGCTLMSNGSRVQRQIDIMRNKLIQLGKNGEIKTISEMDLLLMFLRKYCS